MRYWPALLLACFFGLSCGNTSTDDRSVVYEVYSSGSANGLGSEIAEENPVSGLVRVIEPASGTFTLVRSKKGGAGEGDVVEIRDLSVSSQSFSVTGAGTMTIETDADGMPSGTLQIHAQINGEAIELSTVTPRGQLTTAPFPEFLRVALTGEVLNEIGKPTDSFGVVLFARPRGSS